MNKQVLYAYCLLPPLNMSIPFASAASWGIFTATIVHVLAVSIYAASAATSIASSTAASVALLKSTKLAPLLYHPLSLQDRVRYQPCHA